MGDGGFDVVFRAIHTQTFGRHGIDAVPSIVEQAVHAISNARRPVVSITHARRAGYTQCVTSGTRGVVNVFTTAWSCGSSWCWGSGTFVTGFTQIAHWRDAFSDGLGGFIGRYSGAGKYCAKSEQYCGTKAKALLGYPIS